MVGVEQLTTLIDYLESHKELALGHLSRSIEGRCKAKRLWAECAQLVNAAAADGVKKTGAEWRVFFIEYKSRLVKKIKRMKQEMCATGGGKNNNLCTLTSLQERLYDIIGRDIGEPLPGVRHNPLHESPLHNEDDTDVSGRLTNDSISILQDGAIFYGDERICFETEDVDRTELIDPVIAEPVTVGRVTVFNTDAEPVESVAEPIHSTEPPRRRRPLRSSSAHNSRGSTSLELAQERLERIERLNAESRIEQARAINRLAAAIERIADRLSQDQEYRSRSPI